MRRNSSVSRRTYSWITNSVEDVSERPTPTATTSGREKRELWLRALTLLTVSRLGFVGVIAAEVGAERIGKGLVPTRVAPGNAASMSWMGFAKKKLRFPVFGSETLSQISTT